MCFIEELLRVKKRNNYSKKKRGTGYNPESKRRCDVRHTFLYNVEKNNV